MGNLSSVKITCKSTITQLQASSLSATDAEEGCAKVFFLSRLEPNSEGIREKAVKLINLGVCNLLVRVMNEHPDNVSIAHQWIKAVSALSHCRNSYTEFEKAGICEIMVSALKSHQSSADFVEYWCNAVGYLARDSSIKISFGSFGACEVLVNVIDATIKVHPDGNGIAQWSCRAVESLCANNFEPNKERFLTCGFPKVAQHIATNMNLTQQTRDTASKSLLLFIQPSLNTTTLIKNDEDTIYNSDYDISVKR